MFATIKTHACITTVVATTALILSFPTSEALAGGGYRGSANAPTLPSRSEGVSPGQQSLPTPRAPRANTTSGPLVQLLGGHLRGHTLRLRLGCSASGRLNVTARRGKVAVGPARFRCRAGSGRALVPLGHAGVRRVQAPGGVAVRIGVHAGGRRQQFPARLRIAPGNPSMRASIAGAEAVDVYCKDRGNGNGGDIVTSVNANANFDRMYHDYEEVYWTSYAYSAKTGRLTGSGQWLRYFVQPTFQTWSQNGSVIIGTPAPYGVSQGTNQINWVPDGQWFYTLMYTWTARTGSTSRWIPANRVDGAVWSGGWCSF